MMYPSLPHEIPEGGGGGGAERIIITILLA